MKTIKKTMYLVMVFATVFFTACSSDDDNGGDGEDGGGGSGSEFLTAKVNGTNFEAAQSPAVIVAASVNNDVLAVHGGKNDGETIRISIFNYDGVGTYYTGDNITNVNSLMYLTLTPSATWTSTFDIGSGTIEITSDNGTTVEGTFSFEGFNAQDSTTKNITNGSFKAIIE